LHWGTQSTVVKTVLSASSPVQFYHTQFGFPSQFSFSTRKTVCGTDNLSLVATSQLP
jgi:hypothetical protein